MNVNELLRERAVPFEVLPHERTWTASETAHALHVPGRNFAKTVVLRADGEPVLAVLPANSGLDEEKLERVLGAERVELVEEHELTELFPDCECGAVPPFGTQYGFRTVVDSVIADDEHIVFDGNTHEDAVYMSYRDYARIENPMVADITR